MRRQAGTASLFGAIQLAHPPLSSGLPILGTQAEAAIHKERSERLDVLRELQLLSPPATPSERKKPLRRAPVGFQLRSLVQRRTSGGRV